MSKPQWRPLSYLPSLAHHIDERLKHYQAHYTNLLQAKPKPHVLDDFTVSEVIRVYTDAKQDLPLFDEQIQRWESEYVTAEQRQEIAQLKVQMKKVHEIVDQILQLADE